jgi:hypothetical protein
MLAEGSSGERACLLFGTRAGENMTKGEAS